MRENYGNNPPPLYLRLIKSVLKIPLSELCLPVVHCHKVLTMLLVFSQLDTVNVNLPHCLVDDGRVRVRPMVRVRVMVRNGWATFFVLASISAMLVDAISSLPSKISFSSYITEDGLGLELVLG